MSSLWLPLGPAGVIPENWQTRCLGASLYGVAADLIVMQTVFLVTLQSQVLKKLLGTAKCRFDGVSSGKKEIKVKMH